MQSGDNVKIAIIAGIFVLLVIIRIIMKNKHPVGKTICSVLFGLLCFAAVNATGKFTGVTLPVSVLSLGIASIAGIPGVTMMLVLNIIM